MLKNAGILSLNRTYIAAFKENSPGFEVIEYASIDKIKPNEISILATDINIFKSSENIQFYLSKLRKKLQGVPVLIIISEEDLGTMQADWFFDDFILHPFRSSEVVNRMMIAISRAKFSDDSIMLFAGNIRINTQEYSVFLNDEKIECTYKEFELLRCLVENKGVVFSRKDLLNTIWGIDYIGGTRTVDVHIRRLRSKLGEEFSTIIETVRNVGYRCKSD
jgi:DNA-binding response OmpR family regulator